jgi:hypothetical protein
MGRKKTTSTYSEQMLAIHRQYLAAGGTTPVRLDELYDYAKQAGLWSPPPSDARKRFRQDMARALREDYFVDGAGRTVRRQHAIKVKEMNDEGKMVQKSLWDDIDTGPREHIAAAVQLRRKQIVGDCKQLKNDADHFNDERPKEKPIVLLFDFTDDLIELDQPTTYMPDRGPAA